MSQEDIFRYEEENGTEDNLEAVVRKNGVTITVDEPWQGSTETGFGYKCSIFMDKASAVEFALWLLDAAKRMEPPK